MNPYHRNNSWKLLIRINPYLYPLDLIKLFLSNYYCYKFYLDLYIYIYTYTIRINHELCNILNNIVENFNLELKHSTIVSGD